MKKTYLFTFCSLVLAILLLSSCDKTTVKPDTYVNSQKVALSYLWNLSYSDSLGDVSSLRNYRKSLSFDTASNVLVNELFVVDDVVNTQITSLKYEIKRDSVVFLKDDTIITTYGLIFESAKKISLTSDSEHEIYVRK